VSSNRRFMPGLYRNAAAQLNPRTDPRNTL
jgi:hypothetical protein